MKIVPWLLSVLASAVATSASVAAAASPADASADAAASAAPALQTAAGEPLACRLDALSPAERARHQKLTALLQRAVVGVRELPDGYELALDLSRLPADAQGDPVCVVEIAEWVDLEARCCPFLDFGIAVRGKGTVAPERCAHEDAPGERRADADAPGQGHAPAEAVALALTGGPGVKDFLKSEFAPIQKKLESRP